MLTHALLAVGLTYAPVGSPISANSSNIAQLQVAGAGGPAWRFQVQSGQRPATSEEPLLLDCQHQGGMRFLLRVTPPRFSAFGQPPSVQTVEDRRAPDGLVRSFDGNFLVVDFRADIRDPWETASGGWIRFSINRNNLASVLEIYRRSGTAPPSCQALETVTGTCALNRPRF